MISLMVFHDGECRAPLDFGVDPGDSHLCTGPVRAGGHAELHAHSDDVRGALHRPHYIFDCHETVSLRHDISYRQSVEPGRAKALKARDGVAKALARRLSGFGNSTIWWGGARRGARARRNGQAAGEDDKAVAT